MWQPIETAPLDTVILVWMPTNDVDGFTYPVWPAIITATDEYGDDDPDGERWISIADWSHPEINVSFSVANANPTHWMPLPPPPLDNDSQS